MNTIYKFLSELRCLDVKIWTDGQDIHYKAPKQALTPTILAQLRERKSEILTILHQVNLDAQSQIRSILPVPRDGKLLLSFAQQRLWFMEQLAPGTSLYNNSLAYYLNGLLNITALELSLKEIVRRHESLRTIFPALDGQPHQVILPVNIFTLPIINLKELTPDQQQVEAEKLALKEATQPFDIATESSFRVKLLSLAEKEHILLLTLHHIVNDMWSYNVFSQELTTLYIAFSTNKPSPLPELPIQHVDFAHWQHEWLQGEVLESQLNYWKQQLGGNLPILQLPTDYPHQPVQTYSGAYQSLELSLDLTKSLKDLSQQSGVTLFMTLLAAFQTLLHRYSGQEDIIIGTPIAGRNQVETEGLIGFFANTLAIRINLSDNPSFQQLLSEVREITLAAYYHQDLPFEKLIEKLQPERDLSRSPLFQVMFTFQNTPRQPWKLPGLTISPLETHNGTAKFDLTLDLKETSEGIKGGFEYNTDLFKAATIARMRGHFQTLLEGIVANPQQHLWDLPLLTAAERHQLLVEWNDTKTDYPNNACIHQLFESQVEKTPDAVAVIFENQQLTYQQLNHRANQLAHYLKSLGVKPETPVGICVERSLKLIVALLGILKAGAAYVPLDPAYPSERLAFMLEDASVPILLTQKQLIDKLSSHQAKVVCLDTDWEAISTENLENSQSKIKPTNLAYVIYTSGSTGKPKGVQITHRSFVNFLTAMQQHLQLANLDSMLSVTSLSFDIAGLEIFLPLILGAKVILVSREVTVDGLQLLKQLNNSAATVMQATPATWQMLLEAGWKRNAQLKILCGGEALRQNLANQLRQRGTEVWNLYGPTETTIWSTIHRIDQQEALVTIGRPIANTQIYILDRYLQPLPVGVSGELYIGGTGLARGYLHQPELTKEKFIHNPFSSDSLSRLYKTGDLARYLSDGNIEFLGRLDNQVKVRGFRIELGEIEGAISQHPTIQQTVVTARVDDSIDKRLVAYIIPHSEQTPTTDELHHFLKQKLPEYMVPSAFVFLDTLLLTPNGKIDHCALPAPDQARLDSENTFVAPRDDLEIQLTNIWENILGIKSISIKDNFFNLGGHSLLAVRLFAEIEKTFSKNLPLATLFQAATIEELANILRTKQWLAPENLVLEIQPKGSKSPLYLINALGTGMFAYSNLARYLGLEQPVYGIQAQGLDGQQAPHTCIKDMAKTYIQAIRSLQPEGPYFLGGLSSGGIVAFEMAQQFRALGDNVALLALIDSYYPKSLTSINNTPSPNPSFFKRFRKNIPLREIFFLLSDIAIFLSDSQFKSKQKSSYVLEKIKSVQEKIEQKFKTIIYELYQPTRRPLPYTMRQALVKEATRKAVSDYIPQIYQGKVTLLKASETPYEYQLGWHNLAVGGLEIQEIPGDHRTIIAEPNIRILAEKLKTCLEKAQTNNQGVHQICVVGQAHLNVAQ